MAVSFLVSTITIVIVGSLTWFAYTAFKNLYLHPLAKYPGPKLAAITPLWRAVMDTILCRSFCHELEHLHEQYGISVFLVSSIRSK